MLSSSAVHKSANSDTDTVQTDCSSLFLRPCSRKGLSASMYFMNLTPSAVAREEMHRKTSSFMVALFVINMFRYICISISACWSKKDAWLMAMNFLVKGATFSVSCWIGCPVILERASM